MLNETLKNDVIQLKDNSFNKSKIESTGHLVTCKKRKEMNNLQNIFFVVFVHLSDLCIFPCQT